MFVNLTFIFSFHSFAYSCSEAFICFSPLSYSVCFAFPFTSALPSLPQALLDIPDLCFPFASSSLHRPLPSFLLLVCLPRVLLFFSILFHLSSSPSSRYSLRHNLFSSRGASSEALRQRDGCNSLPNAYFGWCFSPHVFGRTRSPGNAHTRVKILNTFSFSYRLVHFLRLAFKGFSIVNYCLRMTDK